MNISSLNKKIYSYLGFRSAGRSENADVLIGECVKELEGLAHFRYVYKLFNTPPEFLKKQPYASYLKDSTGVILCVTTLGAEIDGKIKFYERTDAARAVVLDACASAYLEELADEYERGLGLNLSYRFCPGYGGSSVEDLKYIFEILKPEKIGLCITDTNYMLPSKSMAGIIAVGNVKKKSCGDCVIAEHCEYRKEGGTCYGSEKK